MDRKTRHERERRTVRETVRDRDGRSPACAAERGRSGQESCSKDREPDRGGESRQQVSRESGLEKAADTKQESRDFDLGL